MTNGPDQAHANRPVEDPAESNYIRQSPLVRILMRRLDTWVQKTLPPGPYGFWLEAMDVE
jgi:hypothetical protein